MPSRRIASLLPAATEIVCALGFADRLVARSHECDYPASAQDAPVVTRPRIDPDASSRQIDEAVKQAAGDSSALFEIDAPKLRSLKPDVIITQAHCEVCAVSEKDLSALMEDWDEPRPEIVSLAPVRFPQLWEDIQAVAEAIGARSQCGELLRELKLKCVEVIERAAVATRKPRVLCLEWLDPLMAGGNWIPDMVGMAGGENLLSESGKHSGWISLDEIAAADPQVIVLMPCGFDLSRTLAEVPTLEKMPGWNRLKAVKKKRVYATDGSAFFNRPGPRLVDSLQILGEIFYPGMIEYGHENTHWRKVY